MVAVEIQNCSDELLEIDGESKVRFLIMRNYLILPPENISSGWVNNLAIKLRKIGTIYNTATLSKIMAEVIR